MALKTIKPRIVEFKVVLSDGAVLHAVGEDGVNGTPRSDLALSPQSKTLVVTHLEESPLARQRAMFTALTVLRST